MPTGIYAMRTLSESRLFIAARSVLAAIALSAMGATAASAYVGSSFVQIPGADGGWQGQQYKHWFKVDANYWQTDDAGRRLGLGRRATYPAPGGPHDGAGKLVIAIDKDNPAL